MKQQKSLKHVVSPVSARGTVRTCPHASHKCYTHLSHMCRAAFKALAYKKYQQVPLYLEWAPVGIWDTPPPAAPAATSPSSPRPPAGVKVHSKPLNDAAAAAQCLEDADDTEQGPVVSIYVKNLNFATTDASLKSHFDSAISAAGGQIHSAKVGDLPCTFMASATCVLHQMTTTPRRREQDCA